VGETVLLVRAYIIWKHVDDVLQIVTIPKKLMSWTIIIAMQVQGKQTEVLHLPDCCWLYLLPLLEPSPIPLRLKRCLG
jgi:hypothetical protein